MDPDEPEMIQEDLYFRQNYLLFALLAGVRNNYHTDEGPLEPIFPPRGLPLDFAAEVVGGRHEGTFIYGHTFTWMTLAEIEAYDFEREIVYSKWISAPFRAVQLAMGYSAPECWHACAAENARIVTLLELDAEIQSGRIDPRAYASIVWRKPISESCFQFLDLLPALRALEPSSEDIRLVIGFDS
jgi:hypothetical protein